MRKNSDTAPESECQSCGVPYAKSDAIFRAPPSRRIYPAMKAEQTSSTGFFSSKVIAIIILAAALGAGYHQWSKKRAADMLSKNLDCKDGEPDVLMYSATYCGVCTMAKQYLDSNKIPYAEKVTDLDANAMKEFDELKGEGFPLLIIGNQRRAGFYPAWIEEQIEPCRPDLTVE